MAAPLPVGLVLDDRFVLSAIIGRGATATVYRAIDRCPHRAAAEVAVKVGGSAVRYEGQVLRALSHPNVVRPHGAGRRGGFYFLAIDLLPGLTLTQILSERAGLGLDRESTLRIVADLGSALASVHRLGLVHGDVKPGNVMIGPGGHAVLFDFAAARSFRAITIGAAPVAFYAARGSDLTPAYASPARLAGEPPDPRDDVYSLAVLACTMFAGRHPFGGLPVTEALERWTRPERPAGLSGAAWAALRRGLALQAEDRPADADAFAASLRRPGAADHFRAWCAAAFLPARLRYAAAVPSLKNREWLT